MTSIDGTALMHERIRRACASADVSGGFGGTSGGKLHLQTLSWDSAQLGVSAARLSVTGQPGDTAALSDAFRELVDSTGAEFISLKVPADHTDWVNAAEELGFRVFDCEITFLKPLGGDTPPAAAVANAEFRRHDPADETPDLSRLDGYAGTRLHRDPRIGVAAADAFWRHSLTDHLSGYAEVCYLALDDGGAVIGMIACHDEQMPGADAPSPLRDLFHVQVAEGARGRGIGAGLMGFALNESRLDGMEAVSVSTQSTNTDALAFYMNAGFRVAAAGYSLHFWTTNDQH